MSADNDKPQDVDAGKTSGSQKPRSHKPKFRRRAEARRDEVLDAALELFTEKGFAATRVDDIAQKAGISKGTIYLYFESKEALMEGLIDRALSPIALKLIEVVDTVGVDPRIVFKTIGKLITERMSDPKVFAVPKLIILESVQFPELAEIYRRDVIDKVLPRIIRLIEHQIELGRFRKVDSELAVRSLIGPIIAHAALSEVFGITPEGGLHMDRLLEQHFDILFNGLSANPERENG